MLSPKQQHTSIFYSEQNIQKSKSVCDNNKEADEIFENFEKLFKATKSDEEYHGNPKNVKKSLNFLFESIWQNSQKNKIRKQKSISVSRTLQSRQRSIPPPNQYASVNNQNQPQQHQQQQNSQHLQPQQRLPSISVTLNPQKKETTQQQDAMMATRNRFRISQASWMNSNNNQNSVQNNNNEGNFRKRNLNHENKENIQKEEKRNMRSNSNQQKQLQQNQQQQGQAKQNMGTNRIVIRKSSQNRSKNIQINNKGLQLNNNLINQQQNSNIFSQSNKTIEGMVSCASNKSFNQQGQKSQIFKKSALQSMNCSKENVEQQPQQQQQQQQNKENVVCIKIKRNFHLRNKSQNIKKKEK